MKYILITISLLCGVVSNCFADAKADEYFIANIDSIQKIFDIKNSDGLIVVKSIMLADSSDDFCRVVDLLSDEYVYDIHKKGVLSKADFNIIKDWYFENKSKLSWELIEDAIDIVVSCKELYFIPHEVKTGRTTTSELEDLLRKRLIRRGILQEK